MTRLPTLLQFFIFYFYYYHFGIPIFDGLWGNTPCPWAKADARLTRRAIAEPSFSHRLCRQGRHGSGPARPGETDDLFPSSFVTAVKGGGYVVGCLVVKEFARGAWCFCSCALLRCYCEDMGGCLVASGAQSRGCVGLGLCLVACSKEMSGTRGHGVRRRQ